ncbi:cytochrome P450 [Actinokineospora sp. UTMC 2448]|uniref:cytochrome P450 n=1 Tax=Actinokineospora sp. UTMC 2448 TaxID=2268449 RepID=UPI002164BC04|nr:cytochrome P450 [Actinokineospora sp. UTMC 2448]UVS79237.1 Pentalenolactone synthase [Actinokineospora sp. UTMC 2448]
MTEQPDLPTSPFDRPDILDIPPAVRRMRERGPVSRFRTMVGDEAWMVTRFAEARRLFLDPRLTRSHPDPENAPRVTHSALLDGSDWEYEDYQAEYDNEAAMRALLAKSFSARRMAALRPRIEALVDDLLTAMAEHGPPVDLVDALARPLPTLVICELLGVPHDERERFQKWSEQGADPMDARGSRAAMGSLFASMGELVERKRADPAEDVLSDLAAACEAGVLDAFSAGAMASGLLFAGNATTVVVIQWGALHLLTNPDQWDALRRDPSLLASAVEEILRRRMSGGEALAHYAGADIEIGGVTIKAGDAVVMNLIGANHDPRAFERPDRFDISRSPNPHLAFGHGRHLCVGRNLARVELRVVFGRLVERFPTLRLAVPVDRLRPNNNPVVGGLRELPATW